jgi:hypothetical protein
MKESTIWNIKQQILNKIRSIDFDEGNEWGASRWTCIELGMGQFYRVALSTVQWLGGCRDPKNKININYYYLKKNLK